MLGVCSALCTSCVRDYWSLWEKGEIRIEKLDKGKSCSGRRGDFIVGDLVKGNLTVDEGDHSQWEN